MNESSVSKSIKSPGSRFLKTTNIQTRQTEIQIVNLDNFKNQLEDDWGSFTFYKKTE